MVKYLSVSKSVIAPLWFTAANSPRHVVCHPAFHLQWIYRLSDRRHKMSTVHIRLQTRQS